MDTVDKRRKNTGSGGGGPNSKNPRRKNKNGLNKAIKEEKISPVLGSDSGVGSCGGGPGSNPNMQDTLDQLSSNQSKGGLPDELLLNGSEIKLENPSTPQLMDSKHLDCGSMSDVPPLPDLGHTDFPDCSKAQMNPYCYPHYNNIQHSNSSMAPHPGDYGPPPPHMMTYHQSQQPPPPLHGPLPPSTKQQPSTLEAQYMQQQSQIFVFSTKLANKAADAVMQGQFPSIISFHTSQLATRKFLECQGNPTWPAPLPPAGKIGKANKNQHHHPPPPSQPTMMQGGGPPPSNMPPDFNMHQVHPPSSPCNMYNMNSKSSPQQNYPHYYDGPGPPLPMGHNMGHGSVMGHGGPPPVHMGPQQHRGMGCPEHMGPNPGGIGPGQGQQSPYFGNGHDGPQSNRLTGVKVRDEDLTPQQRHHREEQLAKLRKLQQVLIPDNEHPGTPGDPNCNTLQSHENLDGYSMQSGLPPSGPMGMDYNMQGSGPNKCGNNEWSSPPGFFMDGPRPGMKQSNNLSHAPPGTNGNGPRSVKPGGSIPSPATPLTPGSSCGAPHRPSPHSPMSGDPLYGGSGPHSFYPSGYYSPQVNQVQENSPSGSVQRKDSESSNSDGGKNRREKSSCSVSPTSSAPSSVKEANLMPVPSPQQIQYLHSFEAQELTIQKQPNMGLSDHPNDGSPGLPVSSLDVNPSTPTLSQQKPSHSAPPTPVSVNSGNPKPNPEALHSTGNSSKARPGSVGPTPTPKSSTTPNPSPGVDRTSQPGTPLSMNMMEMKTSANFVSGMNISGSGPQGPCMMKQLPLSMDSHPDVPSVGGVFDNVPLNPNLAGPPAPGSKHAFDPISSMVQMSQQLGGNGNSPNAPGGGSGSGYGMNTGGPPMNPNMVNFNTSMHSMQNVEGGGIGMGGPQTVNNTYVNATMTIQQMNIQNMPPYMNHGPGPNMGPMSHQMGMAQQMGHMQPIGGPPSNMGISPISGNSNLAMNSSSPMGMNSMTGPPSNLGMNPNNSLGHNMGPNMVPSPMGHNMGPSPMGPNMGPTPMNPMGPMCPGRGPPPPQMYGNQPPPSQRMSGQGGRGSPYRMPNNARAFGGTNIQVKPNAPNTIQYLPARPPPPHNQGQMCSQAGVMGGPGGPRAPPNLEFLQRYTNPTPGPVVNVNMGINVNVNSMPSNRMPYPGAPPGQGMLGGNGPGIPCGGPMRGPNPHGMMDQCPPGGPGQQLPPNMMGGGGRGGVMKNPNDPVYAQRFHEFQQDLYATGTNGRNPNIPPNLQGNPNSASSQQFFK